MRRIVSMVVGALFLLWLLGWLIAAGPHGAWHDISHLATQVYSWVHAEAPRVRSPIKAPATATPPSVP
ncbi:MAG: hypothetical protein M1522_05440 [Actinobacteria bacterium]|nr:hypothetical protein [Actinomycetota bacterium]